MKKIFIFMSLLMMATIISATHQRSITEKQEDSISSVKAEEPKTVTLLFAGDLMQHQAQIDCAKQADGTYNYEECFRYIKNGIQKADIAIANFEMNLAGEPYAGYPRFSAPDEFLVWSMDCGFDVLLTANNHSCDVGKNGLERTINIMDYMNVPHLGTYKNADERKKSYPFVYEQNGIRFAFLNYTYGTNGIKVPEPYIVNGFDRTQIAEDIKAAKALKPDCIIAFMHWGVEYELKQNAQQEEWAQWLLDQGVDHVIGNHPHVVQPVEIRTDGNGDKHLVCYSLGNIISNMSRPNADGGMYINMTLEKDAKGKVTMKHADYSLFWVSRPVVSGHKQHRVYPLTIPDSMLNTEEIRLRQIFLDGARGTFKENNKGIEEK